MKMIVTVLYLSSAWVLLILVLPFLLLQPSHVGLVGTFFRRAGNSVDLMGMMPFILIPVLCVITGTVVRRMNIGRLWQKAAWGLVCSGVVTVVLETSYLLFLTRMAGY